jgi:hypothetical protein
MVDLSISAPIVGAIDIHLNAKYGDFLENGSVIYGDHLPK